MDPRILSIVETVGSAKAITGGSASEPLSTCDNGKPGCDCYGTPCDCDGTPCNIPEHFPPA